MQGFRLGREDAFGEVFRRLQPALVFFARERAGRGKGSGGYCGGLFYQGMGEAGHFLRVAGVKDLPVQGSGQCLYQLVGKGVEGERLAQGF